MKIGFVGLGGMGTGMAQSLLSAGHELAVYNRTRARAEPLRGKGARVADTPADAARGADVVFSMLADDTAVEGVTFGEKGILAGLSKGSVHVSSSTISVAFAERLASTHAAAGQGYLSAPVFGRPEAAAAKQLWILAAGRSEYVDRCMPLFQALGRGVSRLGDTPASANVVKLAGNFIIVSMLETFGETFALTRKAGIAPQAFCDVFMNVFGQSSIFEGYAKKIAAESYEPAGFKASLGLKDVRLALAAGDAMKVPMPVASVVRDQLLEVIARGRGDLDWSVLAQFAAKKAGLDE